MTNTKWLSALLAGTALAVASSAAMADSSLLTISPVADMPASATEVSISGELRVVGSFLNSSNDDAETDMGSRLRVVVQGSTETSVGTVGAYARLEQSNGNDNSSNQVTANKAYG
ncbi:MAG: porin, partial [Aestuariivirgaceae bacterium]|nr:porin [Aestuariivirgaceae bacterium]